MKTLKTAIIAATLTFGAAPAALAVDASASIATSYLFRGEEMNSGSPAVSADVSGSTSGLTYGIWVSSGDTQTEYDLYLDYSGAVGDIGYSVGYVDYNYATSPDESDLEEIYVGLSYGPASVTYYDNQGNDDTYTVVGYEVGDFSFAYGDADSTHFDVSYAVNDSLSLTVSKPEDADAIVVASYSLPF